MTSVRLRCTIRLAAALVAASLLPPGHSAAQQQGGLFTPAIAERPAVSDALGWLEENFPAQVEEWILLTEIPAPSGHERARAEYVKAELEKEGLEVGIDSIGNVIGRRAGTGGGPTVVFASHLDTVHPLDTDLTVRREGNLLHAPGVGDDTNGVANLLAVARAMNRAGVRTRGDVILIGTVQEETGLRGMDYWLETNPGVADMLVAVDGGFESINYGALGIYWTRYFFRGPGSHTNSSAGKPHPVRALARAVESIYQIRIPEGRGGAVYNVGMLDGGEIFNAIPQEVSFTMDLRSVNPALLDSLNAEVEARVAAAAAAEGVEWAKEEVTRNGAGGTEEMLADRRSHPLVVTALDLHRWMGIEARAVASGSTDANVAVVRGIPAITLSKGRGTGAHTLTESAEIDAALPATKLFLLLAVSLAGLP